MKRSIFERLVVESVKALPPTIRTAMNNVAIVIEQEPRQEKLREVSVRRHGILLGLYEGIPLKRRGAGYFGVLPDKITIFQKSIESFSGKDPERLKALVRDVVWHEIGHHIGLNDQELRALERKRRKT